MVFSVQGSFSIPRGKDVPWCSAWSKAFGSFNTHTHKWSKKYVADWNLDPQRKKKIPVIMFLKFKPEEWDRQSLRWLKVWNIVKILEKKNKNRAWTGDLTYSDCISLHHSAEQIPWITLSDDVRTHDFKQGPYFVKEVYCILKRLSLSFLISHHHLFSHSKTSSRTGLINLYWAWRVKITWLVRSIYISSAFECDSEIHKVIKTTSRFIAFKTCFGLIIINGDLNFGMLSNQISGLGHDLKSRSTPA